MRKVTREAAIAFLNGDRFTSGNTAVRVSDGMARMYLHGNCIAERFLNEPRHKLYVTDARWQTNTTKERLNGLLSLALPDRGARVFQKDYLWYLTLDDGNHLMEPGEWYALDSAKLAACAA